MKAEDHVEIDIAKAELAFSHNKKYQDLVVRARFKRMSCEATNMAKEFTGRRTKTCSSMTYCECHIAGGERQTTNVGTCREFRDYFEKLFPCVPDAEYLVRLVYPTEGTGKSAALPRTQLVRHLFH